MKGRPYIADHLSILELKERARKSKDPVEARRWHLLYKIALGWSIKNSAIATGISYKYAQSILQKYNQNGLEAVINKKKNYKKTESKKALLNSSQLKKLSESLTKKPSDGGIWTGAKVARWIEKETGIKKVWNQRGWDYLKKLNYSWQRPRPKHRKGNPEEQAQ